MADPRLIRPPDDLDWQTWVDRWDRMQQHYLVKRSERLETVCRTVAQTQPSVERVVDLGCGTGSLMLAFLEAFPDAEVCGIDLDPRLLWLAEARLARFGSRARLVLADLRGGSWKEEVPKPADSVVSATALHWLSPAQIARLYREVHQVMRVGGIFLNADHVASDSMQIQRYWERHREQMRSAESDPEIIQEREPWDGFWSSYSEALGPAAHPIDPTPIGDREGAVEEGMPLAWHLDRLREVGFAHVDCFWRCDCDAIYGGVRTGMPDPVTS